MTRRTKIILGLIAVAGGIIWAGFGKSVANKKRLIGTWTFISGGTSWGSWGETTLTFNDDGKLKMSSQWDRKTYDSEGTYAVKGDTIEMLIAVDSNWSQETWSDWTNWTKKDDGGKSDKSNTSAKWKLQSQPKQQREPILRSVTIRSLSDTELVVADERGQKTIYARK